ncbi:hypothetical protein CDAR_468251 [Caerostris darwini]|uniref:Uncharacterized protein n=1 Tax=Caerostris darwini TaxID=1538125 RepID=A0AAV4WXY5_9ARAC|nr:hypothetical protein CDAR_468251 [Caerostris darwini]
MEGTMGNTGSNGRARMMSDPRHREQGTVGSHKGNPVPFSMRKSSPGSFLFGTSGQIFYDIHEVCFTSNSKSMYRNLTLTPFARALSKASLPQTRAWKTPHVPKGVQEDGSIGDLRTHSSGTPKRS